MTNQQTSAGPIIPPETASLRMLTVTMAVMCYLACLAIGALIVIDRSVDNWTQGLSSEITVQIRETAETDIEKKLSAAAEILKVTDGVFSIEVLDRSVGVEMLRPWLGGTNLDELPVPRLIRVSIDNAKPPDFADLEERLQKAVPGAGLDTHQRWTTELTRMATTLSRISWLILFLICASAVAMVIFAAHAVLDANRDIVDVLHLVGARDNYVAGQIDQRFLRTGFLAGFIGLGLALATFLAASLSGESAMNPIAAASQSLLYPKDGPIWQTYAILLSVPVTATLIALLTSRLTLTRILGRLS